MLFVLEKEEKIIPSMNYGNLGIAGFVDYISHLELWEWGRLSVGLFTPRGGSLICFWEANRFDSGPAGETQRHTKKRRRTAR